MSCEGPLLQVHPQHTPAPHCSPMALDPRNSHLFLPQGRSRANSASGQTLEVPGEDCLQFSLSSPPSPESSLLSGSLGLPLSSNFSRSKSLPRGSRGVSAEPLPVDPLSNSATQHSMRAALSPRFIRRTATIDTPKIAKEEYEEFMLVNQYKVVGIIGSGSYGIVRKATTDENDTYAMKMVYKSRLRRKSFQLRPRLSPRNRQATVGAHPSPLPDLKVKSPLDNIHREIAILKKLDHPNVVKLIEVLDDPREDELILVFEYIQKGSVMKEITPSEALTEDQAREYFIDIILGLEYLHSQHIIHRDIKPDNLLLDEEGHVKIADFGVSEEIDTSETQLFRSAGTPAFIAPECLDAATKSYRGQAVDIWAAGITLYCFIYGKVPFSAKVILELYDIIKTEQVQFPPSPEVSSELKDLLCRLLDKDATKRITIPEIREHAWVRNTKRCIPTKEENCNDEIFVNQEEIATAFKPFRTPIHILVMIKQMAKKRSFSNPYSPKNSPRSSPRETPSPSPSHSPTSPLPPSSPSPFTKRRHNLLKSHQTPTICIDNAELELNN